MAKSHVSGRASEPTPAQLKELFAQIESGRITKNQLQKLLRSPQPEFPTYTLPVDYNQTVEQLVADGQYDWVNSNTSSAHFPLARSGRELVEIELVEIDRPLATETILRLIDQRNLRRPNIKEGLSLGIWYPDLQRQDPIAILCEPWRHSDGGLDVPCLYGLDSDRHLSLNWFGGDWLPGWRFAAVRK